MLIRSITKNALDKKISIRQFPSPEHPYIAFPHKNLAVLDISRFTFCKVDYSGESNRSRANVCLSMAEILRKVISFRMDLGLFDTSLQTMMWWSVNKDSTETFVKTEPVTGVITRSRMLSRECVADFTCCCRLVSLRIAAKLLAFLSSTFP